MTRTFSLESVKNTAIDAMLKAGREYDADWTEGRVGPSRARAPELFYQVKIAERIRDLPFRPAVFLEYNGGDALEYNTEHMRQRRCGPQPEILKGKNIDILVAPKKRGNNFQPFRIALEIKRNVSKWHGKQGAIEYDVLRLSELVRSTGFQMGLSLFVTGHTEGRRGENDFAHRWKDLKDNLDEYEKHNRDLRLSLICPDDNEGGIRQFRKGRDDVRPVAWYVSGLDIRIRR